MGSGVSAGPSSPPMGRAGHAQTRMPQSLSKRRSEDGAFLRSASPGRIPEGGRDGVLGLLVRPGSASRLACTGRPSNGSLARALTHSRDGRPSLGSGFALRCSQRLSGPRAASRRCPLAGQPRHRSRVHPGPCVLRMDSLRPPAPTTDRDQTVSRRFEPSSRTALIGEQPNPWKGLPLQDAMSRHRGAKPARRSELLEPISLLSPG